MFITIRKVYHFLVETMIYFTQSKQNMYNVTSSLWSLIEGGIANVGYFFHPRIFIRTPVKHFLENNKQIDNNENKGFL